MKVTIVDSHSNTAETIAFAATVCTNPQGKKMPHVDAQALLERVVGYGHESILEHSSLTISIKGISRACSHQLVRHRHFSFAQQSQRYVELDGEDIFVTPKTIENGSVEEILFNNACYQTMLTYENLLNAGIPPEDARFVLPVATKTNIVVTGNLRTWKEFLEKRLCVKAQWEMRELAEMIAKQIQPYYGAIKLAPPCGTKGECATCGGNEW